MSQANSVVVRIPRNGETVGYRVSPEILASLVQEIITSSSPEALSAFSEEEVMDVLDCVDEILYTDPNIKPFKERLTEFLKKVSK